MSQSSIFELWPISWLTFDLLSSKTNKFIPRSVPTCTWSSMEIALSPWSVWREQTNNATDKRKRPAC